MEILTRCPQLCRDNLYLFFYSIPAFRPSQLRCAGQGTVVVIVAMMLQLYVMRKLKSAASLASRMLSCNRHQLQTRRRPASSIQQRRNSSSVGCCATSLCISDAPLSSLLHVQIHHCYRRAKRRRRRRRRRRSHINYAENTSCIAIARIDFRRFLPLFDSENSRVGHVSIFQTQSNPIDS